MTEEEFHTPEIIIGIIILHKQGMPIGWDMYKEAKTKHPEYFKDGNLVFPDTPTSSAS